MTSMISLIVVLLAAYAYSAPVVSDVQNATVIMEVENATSLTEGENVTVGFQTANMLILAGQGASVVANKNNGKPNVGLSSSESDSNEATDKPSPRQVDESTTDVVAERQDNLTTDENTKRGIEVESFESSTVVDETSTGEDSSVPSTSEVNIERSGQEFPSLTTEAGRAFNQRAIGSVESVQADESSTMITIKVQPESTTEEQEPSSSSTMEYVETTESSSTSDYETTVVPMEESSSASSFPSESTAKILAIIPGTISRTQYVVPPVRQGQLSQGENPTIVETKKPNY